MVIWLAVLLPRMVPTALFAFGISHVADVIQFYPVVKKAAGVVVGADAVVVTPAHLNVLTCVLASSTKTRTLLTSARLGARVALVEGSLATLEPSSSSLASPESVVFCS